MKMYPKYIYLNEYQNENDDSEKLFCAIFERHIHQGIYSPIIGDNYLISIDKIAKNNSHDSITLISVSLSNINSPKYINVTDDYSNIYKRENFNQLENSATELSFDINYKKSINVIANKRYELNEEIESQEFIDKAESGLQKESQSRNSKSSGSKINSDINSLVGKIIEIEKTEQDRRSFDNEGLVSPDSSDTFVGINELTSVIPSEEIYGSFSKPKVASRINYLELNNNSRKKSREINEEEIEKIVVVINPDSAK
ncbi:hypothetical protein KQX54_020617 [Cotesia glomerata]|uniref:Uncharacterized protein n=1 Tax=Cotesia glomerata TaxID=32391 RepID=A0AAV7IG75_COTGL|nr:hypothetical protein KQX54_020617 [Cotesia glomerata]